jgi:alkanesulfonate monooxygenase SsuD/methylene tetrahydromethanopterin reductase-like flavin-dependent oxidoreductase (luciferase family)
MVQHADREGLDHFSLSDHPYLGERLDAYATIGFVLGRTQHIATRSMGSCSCRTPANWTRAVR